MEMLGVLAYFIGSFVGRILDPIVIILGVVAGNFIRARIYLMLAAVTVAVVQEIVLSQLQITRSFRPVSFMAGVTAAYLVVWATAAFVERRAARRKASNHRATT